MTPTHQTSPAVKAATLRQLLAGDRLAKAVGGNDALSSILAERHGFDALWASGLSISTAHGVPDASILTMTEFLDAARIMNRSTRLPVIADCDSGFGDVNVVMRMVRDYEAAGIAGVCIEDKPFPKRNSFVGNQSLVSPEEFATKLRAAKHAQASPHFVVIARIESFIAGTGADDAIERAWSYQEAGADALVIHSKAAGPQEVCGFAERWRSEGGAIPLVAIPTTYYGITGAQLEAAGFALVIYANHALRASLQAIDEAFGKLRAADGSAPLEGELAGLHEVLDLVGTSALDEEAARVTAGVQR